MISIAIIDTIGLVYDGSTLSKRGLGGSESAVILISKQLAAIGFDVTVYNNCEDSHAKPGIYNGVEFKPIKYCRDATHDIVISSRTVVPLCPEQYFKNFTDTTLDFDTFRNLHKAKLKILWLHDTFCVGDQLIEELVLSGHINEIFTLSDFHTSYITNCDHGNRRNFEVLKKNMFMTRNGAVNHCEWVDIKAKDPDLFVYNASVTKGMIPLITKIWPSIKKNIPEAKLIIIGGFYRFKDNALPDKQEEDWHALRKNHESENTGISFTGIIRQNEIAEILSKASYFLYPAAFPETFGISMLESMLYNTPLITCRFGATEETAIEHASYMIDYAIEPNSLFPNINTDQQCAKFIDMTLRAHADKYLHQQKMYACNLVKDISNWNTIALQWKQHFFKKLGVYMDVAEYRKVQDINDRVHRVFGRRFSNNEEWRIRKNKEQDIVVITPLYNARNYIEECIDSVAAQDYDNWKMIVIDDASTDDSYDVAKNYIASMPKHIQQKIDIHRNATNVGAVCNQITTLKSIDIGINAESIIMFIDGDDCLANDPHIFDMYNNMFRDGAEFSYGSCWSMADNIPLIAQPYPPEVKKNKSYRQYKFNWGMPYTHLRVFRKYLIDKIPYSSFQDSDGNWFKAGGDNSTFYNILEKADPDKVKVVSDIVYLYNDKNPINDYKVNSEEQTKNMEQLTNSKAYVYNPKKILIAIPTAKYIESETFKAIYDLEVPIGYETDFQFFYGYNIDQIRNLIANWAQKYDYLFSVDSDIVMPPDTLKKLIAHNKDIVTGMYIQRIPETHALEIFGMGGRMPYDLIKGQGLLEIDGCGFGCVLVKSEVFKAIEYPQFVYHSALDHKDTISEDTDFCLKAKNKGFKVWVDTSIKCNHKGTTWFNIEDNAETEDMIKLRHLSNQDLLPLNHIMYLASMKKTNIIPKVVYDIGACVLHWHREAVKIWNDSAYFIFEAMDETAFLYEEKKLSYHCGVLTDRDNKIVDFYQNTEHPGGNSYYLENSVVNPEARDYFNESHRRKKVGMKLDSIVKQKSLPLPNLIKMDIQGAELDVLKGAEMCLEHANDLILELQHTEYNKGAPASDIVILYLKEKGFELVSQFTKTPYDGDYHFRKITKTI
jgi:FkbM family methyltransferase